jgi:hypothetical protein
LASIGVKLGPRKQLLDALADQAKVQKYGKPKDVEHAEVKRSLSKVRKRAF